MIGYIKKFINSDFSKPLNVGISNNEARLEYIRQVSDSINVNLIDLIPRHDLKSVRFSVSVSPNDVTKVLFQLPGDVELAGVIIDSFPFPNFSKVSLVNLELLGAKTPIVMGSNMDLQNKIPAGPLKAVVERIGTWSGTAQIIKGVVYYRI